jgi:adenosylcobinamide-GDP ribazoletransferase
MRGSKTVKDAALALSLLTIVTTAARWSDAEDPQVAAWFPAVGALLGGVGWGLAHLATFFGLQERAALVVAALIVVVWALCTRALHWDGLADVADGYWGSPDMSSRLEIMADSATGAFGATAVALVAIVEIAALGSILSVPHELVIFVVPILARFAATAAAWFGSPARPDGLGRSVMGKPTLGGALVAGLPLVLGLAVMAWAYGPLGGAFAAVGVVVALAVPHLLARRFGGVTGDVMGASVLLTEALLFAAFALLP